MSGLFFIVAILLVIYFLPSIVAASRLHKSSASVFVLNLFLGWTFIGWVVALALAFSSNVEKKGYY